MSLITNAATSGKPQVFDLLDDLFEFQQSCPKEGLFYCLQPLVVQVRLCKEIRRFIE